MFFGDCFGCREMEEWLGDGGRIGWVGGGGVVVGSGSRLGEE